MANKICPTCQEKVGVRTIVCPNCKLDFPVIKEEKKKKKVHVLPVENVFIPGKNPNDKSPFCPVKPKGNSEQDIIDWVRAVKEAGLEDRKNYLVSAIKYFANEFWPRIQKTRGINPEYKKVCEIINAEGD